MILKLIYGRQIHVYDLKSNESLDDLHEKIRQIFKKLPDHFILAYQDASQFQQEIKNNEQLDLFRSFKNNSKTVKLFIKAVEEMKKQKVSKSQELINFQKEEQLYDVTQKIELNKEIESLTEELTNHIMPPQEINNQQQDPHEPHQNLSETKQFENLSVSPQNQAFSQPIEQREQPSQRELHIKFEESSNPEFISKPEALGGSDEKQNLNTQSQQNQIQQIPKQHQNKSQIQQNILPAKKSIEVDRDEPKISDQSEEDFRTHYVKCDMCNIHPIYGSRYKCVLCQDYDMCQKCQEKFSHEHPLLKICYTYQTPIRINVQIPELKFEKNNQQHQAKMETINLKDMSQQQRSQRVLSMASEIAELLDMDIGKCLRFIELNEHYTKEKIIQMLINRKQQKESKEPRVRHQQENWKRQDLGKFFNSLKNMFSR